LSLVSRWEDGPVVDEDVEHAQEGNEEASAPFSLESNSNHDTRSQSNDRDDHSCERPFSLEDESDKEEDEEDSAGQLEAACQYLLD
jgi:hypothetical protein